VVEAAAGRPGELLGLRRSLPVAGRHSSFVSSPDDAGQGRGKGHAQKRELARRRSLPATGRRISLTAWPPRASTTSADRRSSPWQGVRSGVGPNR
jgi:hypothetical protein